MNGEAARLGEVWWCGLDMGAVEANAQRGRRLHDDIQYRLIQLGHGPSSVYTASTNDICQGLCEPSAQREEHGRSGH